MTHLSYAALANPRRANAGLLVCALIALGTIAAEIVKPDLVPHAAAHWRARLPLYDDAYRRAAPSTAIYAAEVVRVIDGDTFVARVRTSPDMRPDVWSGIWSTRAIETKVRLRDIDAAELHARCGKELRLALAARAALQRLLAAGRVTLSHVGRDKYPGRIDANVATPDTADVSAAMLNGGFARRYDGGRRGSWCR
jgi:endonuclease YncB( thermonuclease family)